MRYVAPLEEANSYVRGGYSTQQNVGVLQRAQQRQQLLQEPFAIEDEERYSRRPTTFIGKAFDLLSRGEYAVASILHSATNEESETLSQVLGTAATEFANPTHRFTMHDVMKNVAPEFVARRPKTAAALSFAGSIALDPLTYLTFGAGGAAKIGVKGAGIAVNVQRGKRTGRFFETVAKNVGEDGVTKRAHETAVAGLQHILNPIELSKDALAAGKKADDLAARGKVLGPKQQRAYDRYSASVRGSFAEGEARKALEELGYDIYDVVDKGGLKFAGKTLVTSKKVQESARLVADTTGVTRVFSKLAELPGARDVAAALGEVGGSVKNLGTTLFSQQGTLRRSLAKQGRDDGFLEEYNSLRAMAEARALQGDADAREMAFNMFEGFSKKEREEIGKVLHEAQTESYRKYRSGQESFKTAQGLGAVPSNLTGDEFGQLVAKQSADDVLQDVLQRSNLTDDQREAVRKFRMTMDDMALLERDVDALHSFIVNYTPVFHKNFRKSPKEYLEERAALARDGSLPLSHTPDKQRVFATVEQARAAGYEPITDIAEIAAMRFSMHKQAVNQHTFEGSLKELFGGAKVPQTVRDDFARTLRVHVDTNDLHAQAGPVLKVLNKIQGIFKTSATVLNPAFSVKQMLGAEVQRVAGGSSSLEATYRALKQNPAFALKDPNALFHSTLAVMRGKLPDGISTSFGRVYDKAELEDIYRQFPIMKNQTVEGIQSGQGRLSKRITERIDAERAKSGDADLDGMWKLFKRSTRYTELPQKVEDINRSATFLDLLGQGFTPHEAYKRMEKIHFNYSSGLTKYEDTLMTGVMPFYRFTKFAAVLTGNMLGTQPGRAATIAKTQRELMNVYGKIDPLYDGDLEGIESLTPAERHALPGFLFEQPSAFAGFDPELREAVFRMFGGVNFLDFLNIVQLDDDGSFNTEAAKRTLVQGGMAQFTPFVKAPLEYVFETEFFTGFKRGEDGSGRRDIDEEAFFTALTSAIGAQVGGGTGAGAAAGAALGGAIERLGAFEAAKQLLGWEVAVDPRDGVEKTYVNTFTTVLAANFFPQFRTALGLAREDLDPMEKSMKLFGGVSTVKLDLQDRRQRKLNDATMELREARSRYKRLLSSGRKGRAEQAYEDLQQAVLLMQEEHQKLGGLVRGPQGGV